MRVLVLAKPDVLRRRSGSRVTIRTMKPRPVNADGEITTATPAEFALLHKVLTVMVPPTPADLAEHVKASPALTTQT